jgi:hypothetical protein
MTSDTPNRLPPAVPSSPAPTPPQPGRGRARGRLRPSGRAAALLIGLALVLGTSLGSVAFQLTPFDASDAPSPGQGVARVVAQGVSPFEDGEYAWRMVVYTAQPRDAARAVARPFGFVVGLDDPILLSNDDVDEPGEQLTPVARLVGGEVQIVPQGTDQQRASLSDQPVDYVAVELVPIDEIDDVGTGALVFKTDPITISAGQFDMDCVNAFLRPDETTFIPDYGQPTLILATDGAIDVIPSGGRRRTLQPGEGDLFSGELTIEVNADAARSGAGNAKRLMGQPAPSGGAVFFAGVLGPDVPPAPDSTPTQVPIQQIPTQAPAPPPTEAPADDPTATTATEPTPEPTPEPTATTEPTIPSTDPDGDGLSDAIEARLRTDPTNPDTDGDGLKDGDEVNVYGTNPTNPDTDDDGLTDGEEVFVYATSPLSRDTDRDGCTDGFEIEDGSDPLNGQDCSTLR